jgi:hypothetical protein
MYLPLDSVLIDDEYYPRNNLNWRHTQSEYNATTGAAINTNLITRLSTPSGLDEPRTSQSVKGAEVLFRRVEEFDIMLKKTADDKYLSQVRSGCRNGWIRQ